MTRMSGSASPAAVEVLAWDREATRLWLVTDWRTAPGGRRVVLAVARRRRGGWYLTRRGALRPEAGPILGRSRAYAALRRLPLGGGGIATALADSPVQLGVPVEDRSAFPVAGSTCPDVRVFLVWPRVWAWTCTRHAGHGEEGYASRGDAAGAAHCPGVNGPVASWPLATTSIQVHPIRIV